MMYQVEGETNPVAKCRVSKTLCHDQPVAAIGRQIFKRAKLQGAQLENILHNCSGASRASSSQYHTCSALHRRSQGVQQEIQNKLPLTHRVGQLDATDSEKGHPIHVRSLCCSRAPRAVPQRVPLGRASVTRCSAAWSMAPAG